jgi:hypothetical protein
MNSLLKLEQPLVDLKNMAGLIGHLSTSEREVTGAELSHIQTVLEECHEDLHTWWESAISKDDDKESKAEVTAIRAELAALKLSHAPPGSEADVKRARSGWWLLTSAALTVISEAEAAGVKPGERAAALEKGAGEQTDPTS